MEEPTLFVATPLADGRMHLGYTIGLLEVARDFAGRYRMDTQSGFLPRARDGLTHRFLESGASHMLNVDSDISWSADDAQALINTGLDFVSGCYATKTEDRKIPAAVLDGDEKAQIVEAYFVPGGFLLVTRETVLKMVEHYGELRYHQDGLGDVVGLWLPIYEGNRYYSEDISFCRRWRSMGGKIWLHRGVILDHTGQATFRPKLEEVRP